MKWSHVFFAGCLWVLSSPAQAGEPASQKAENAALTAQAAALYDQGAAAYKNEKWPEARAAFLAAWALEKHWQIAGNLADAEMQMGLYRDAAEHASFYRQKAPEDRHVRADTLLARAKARVLTVRIETEPPGADVWIDGQSAGRTPLAEPIFLEPGKHTVTARMASRPEAKVEIDKGAGVEEVVRLHVKAGQTAVPPPTTRSMVPAYALGGAGIASLLAGGVLLGVGLADSAEARTRAPRDSQGQLMCSTRGSQFDRGDAVQADCDNLRSLSSSAALLANTGIGLLVVGGALGASAGLYLLWPAAPARATGPATTVLPVVGSTGGGIIWQGSF